MSTTKKNKHGRKLVTKINDEISIRADKNQYIVEINDNFYGNNVWYFPTLDMCFLDIFDYLCKKRLTTNEDKKIEDVARIIGETRKEILKIMKPFVDISK